MNKYKPPKNYDDDWRMWLIIFLMFLVLSFVGLKLLEITRYTNELRQQTFNQAVDIMNNNP